MSESQQKKIAREAVDKITKEFTDKGLIVEAGWMSLRTLALHEDTPPLQIDEMRSAFFAGAHHLFVSIMTVLDTGEEPTEKDMERLDLIHKELHNFIENYRFKHLVKPQGSA